MYQVSKPILMGLSHLMKISILSRHSCLRGSVLDISLSCSVMSSGKIRQTNQPSQKKLVRPKNGGKRDVITKTWSLSWPRTIPNKRIMMILGKYLVTSHSQSCIPLQQPKPIRPPTLRARPPLNILLSHESSLLPVIGCKSQLPPLCAPWIAPPLKLLITK